MSKHSMEEHVRSEIGRCKVLMWKNLLVQEGRIRVLYVAPERMGSPSLLSALAPMLPLPLVCIDEAHCIAEWGHNFRCAPSLRHGSLMHRFPSKLFPLCQSVATHQRSMLSLNRVVLHITFHLSVHGI